MTRYSASTGTREIPDDTGQILSAIRDEAHRFAKKYHESKRDNIDPVLEEIDGLGEKKRKALMQAFTIEELRKASTDQMETVKRIGEDMSQKIKRHIENK
jgi:Nuclease subunit of the excinuclease complex